MENNNNDMTLADKCQIEKIFAEAKAEQSAQTEENEAVYPEECCDATEISDEEYARWARGSEKGFWRTFIEDQRS